MKNTVWLQRKIYFSTYRQSSASSSPIAGLPAPRWQPRQRKPSLPTGEKYTNNAFTKTFYTGILSCVWNRAAFSTFGLLWWPFTATPAPMSLHNSKIPRDRCVTVISSYALWTCLFVPNSLMTIRSLIAWYSGLCCPSNVKTNSKLKLTSLWLNFFLQIYQTGWNSGKHGRCGCFKA